ncbi:MAG: coproporphyrinogen dehydrogenase HemZ [Clostridia bacterium]|nr:coproporphyrinogen dehydrogenase HemZ [Clostridia bacterium]
MILHVDGNINKYYVQTLCMVFFPGATFGENEEPRSDTPEVTVSTYLDKEGAETAYASIKLNDKETEAIVTVSDDEPLTIATRSAIAAGRALFAAGKELLGYVPPWGILTGVRPAKVATGLIRSTGGIIKSKRVLRDEFFLSPQKAALAVSVAQNEMKLTKKIPQNSCSLYISIPFCPSRCAYCSFVSYTTPRLLSLIDEYIEALIDDLDETFSVIKELGLDVITVYIGGGTPTTLSEKQLERILSKVYENIDREKLTEFTLEAGRPDTITKEKLSVAKRYGVTRVSVNPQTLEDSILKEIGRKHTAEDFFRAYEIAKESGIRDINVDLIAGLPGDDFKKFAHTLDRIIELEPTNITVHTFCVKKASDLLKNDTGVYSLSGGDAAKSVSYSQLRTKFSGYKPYYMYRQKNTVGNLENVGFSKEGHEGMYNIYMMEEMQTIFAVGAGSVTKLVDYNREDESKNRIERIFKPKYPYEYLREHEKKKSGECQDESKSLRAKVLKFYKT